MEYMHCNDMPNGENLIVAIASYLGYNQEDSIIINKNSIERGCFNLTYFKNMIETEEKSDNEALVFKNSVHLVKQEGVDVENLRLANYKKIDDNGLPKVNSHIHENDVIFGKCAVSSEYVDEESNLNIFNAKVSQMSAKRCKKCAVGCSNGSRSLTR